MNRVPGRPEGPTLGPTLPRNQPTTSSGTYVRCNPTRADSTTRGELQPRRTVEALRHRPDEFDVAVAVDVLLQITGEQARLNASAALLEHALPLRAADDRY